MTIDRFLLLVRQNFGLVSIKFPGLDSMNTVVHHYTIGILRSLKSLKDLNLQWTSLDVETLLKAIPQLE